eukprot:SAG31_NODE_273_length_18667_cov_3.603619_2_plen_138_part_00
MILVKPPENGWHRVDIRGGRWRNAEGVDLAFMFTTHRPCISEILPAGDAFEHLRRKGVEWGIRGPVDAGGEVFEAERDCIYHVQEKCSKTWADGCRLLVRRDKVDPSQIVSFRWLSDTYYRDNSGAPLENTEVGGGM